MKKKLYILGVMLMGTMMAGAKTPTQPVVHSDETAMVYYLPKTELVVEVEYEQVMREAGKFYQYAERYLGTKDVITKNDTLFRITSLQLSTHAIPDKERVYTVVLDEKNAANTLLCTTREGLLYGVNVTPLAVPEAPSVTLDYATDSTAFTPSVLPLMEAQMMAGSTGKMAEGAAKMIYQLREARMDILSGENTDALNPGTLPRILKELETQEQELTSLFTGRTKIVKKHCQVHIELKGNVEQAVAFRFSEQTGIVDTLDLSGEPYYLHIDAQKRKYTRTEEAKTSSKGPKGITQKGKDTKKDKKEVTEESRIYYNLPGEAHIELRSMLKVVATLTAPVAQWGVALPLQEELLRQGASVCIDTETGNILSISK